MVDDVAYFYQTGAIPGKIDESAIIGYTTSYTDMFPDKDGETNFNQELNMPYAKVEVYITMNGIYTLRCQTDTDKE